ncbi:hypothetical protein RGF92_003773 [Proteus mirabilis]|uniref:hypothetical protein n=1 Tax=Proteus mirabilis TaxID=584 RepID=UPI001C43B991|nr:hypothetical protein [Proteus mirabilis]ELA6789752.1 hypothetical protein [Proteus mirabilis]
MAVSPLTATAAVQGAQARVLRFPIRPPALSANRRWCSLGLSWVALHALTGI